MASTTIQEVLDRNFNREGLSAFIRKYAIVLIFIAMFVAMTFLTDAFLQPRNLVNVVRQISVVGLIAIDARRATRLTLSSHGEGISGKSNTTSKEIVSICI